MHNFEKLFKISRLISRSLIKGEKPEGGGELGQWLHADLTNRRFFEELATGDSLENKLEEYRSINAERAWQKVRGRIDVQPRTSKWTLVMRWAAILVIPLLVGGLIYHLLPNSKPVEVAVVVPQEIKPGSAQALLILSDGTRVDLTDQSSTRLADQDGTTIENGMSNLSYCHKPTAENPTSQLIYNELHIPKGGEYRLELADGTKIWLNSATTLKYPTRFANGKREVFLEGEAFFEVASNPKSPFEVHTATMTTRAIGTAFNVMAYGDEQQIVTTLVEGTVLFSETGAKAPLALEPGMQAVYSKGNESVVVGKVDVRAYTAWKDGEFVFHNMPLHQIMTILSRWYNFEVFYQNPGVAHLHFTGDLKRYGDLNTLLDMISLTTRVTFEVKSGVVIVRER
ncbi:MAG: FecR family protein [Breznakibacter sp.]